MSFVLQAVQQALQLVATATSTCLLTQLSQQLS
jgi:hypothetical protein